MSQAMLAETCKRVDVVERKVHVAACKMTAQELREIVRRLDSIEATLKVIAKQVLKDSGRR